MADEGNREQGRAGGPAPLAPAGEGCLHQLLAWAPLLLLVLAVLALAVPRFGGSPWKARTCYANLRVLQSAVEMHNLDNQARIDVLDPAALGQLQAGQYLKTRPTCPGGAIPDPPPAWARTMAGSEIGYMILRVVRPSLLYHHPPGTYAGQGLTGTGAIECSLHGACP